MRSKKLIVEDERQEDFDRLAAGWRAEYGDEGQAAESLLERVILNDWFLRRAERRYLEAEWELAQEEQEWTEEQHKKIERYLRYKTTHERSFYRAFQAVRGLRKDRIREELDLENVKVRVDGMMREAFAKAESEHRTKQSETKKAEGTEAASTPEANRAQAVFGPAKAKSAGRGKGAGKKQRELLVLDQWVEVEIEDGKAVTRLYPSNEGLIEEGRAMERIPDLVYRRMNFPNGIPEEYLWTYDGDAERRERGGCECEVCVRNREVLERRAGE